MKEGLVEVKAKVSRRGQPWSIYANKKKWSDSSVNKFDIQVIADICT